MTYKLGVYKLQDNTRYDLDILSHEEGRLFLWLMKEYETAASWSSFQERTARTLVEAAKKAEQLWRKKGYAAHWENYSLYRIRADLLRNVGIRNGELKGELSEMLISAEQE